MSERASLKKTGFLTSCLGDRVTRLAADDVVLDAGEGVDDDDDDGGGASFSSVGHSD